MDEEKELAGKEEVVISDCPVLSVVVYADRAEVNYHYKRISYNWLCLINYT